MPLYRSNGTVREEEQKAKGGKKQRLEGHTAARGEEGPRYRGQ